MTNTRSSKIVKTGGIGEQIIADYLRESGQYDTVEFSENKFDMAKDIVATKDGEKFNIECKTRTVIRKYYGLALSVDQWYKADNADRLFFVTNPTSMDEPISVYESNKDDYTVLSNFGRSGNGAVRMYDMTKMKKVKTIKDKQLIKELYDLSVSSYKQ